MRTLAGLLACWLAAAAVPACAQAQAPAEPEPQAKKAPAPLKLKLDERPAAAPRIMFEPRDAGARNPGSTLPTLGSPTRSFDAPTGFGGRSDSGAGSPYPKDTNPGY